ncbi:hypothetical protein [Nocardia grenadensis]|uniref:hypothetical protein n=1 Tax=Nocardia grenadensis TaxID=931537 RepID=UPI003D7059A7
MSEFAKHLQNALNGTNDLVSRDELKEMLSGYLHAPAKPVYDPEAEALGEAIQEKLSGRGGLKDELLGRMHAAGIDVRNWTPPPSRINPEAQRLLDIADRMKAEREAQNTQEIRGPVDLGWSEAGDSGALNSSFKYLER